MNTKQLRQKILDLAIKGKLVPQDPNDEPASKLIERIREEKEQLIKEGKLKRDKNESYIFVGDDKLHYEKFADGTEEQVELPATIFSHITDELYEGKIVYRTNKFEDYVRTFCMNPNGIVVNENTNGIKTVNGHSFEDPSKKTKNNITSILKCRRRYKYRIT